MRYSVEGRACRPSSSSAAGRGRPVLHWRSFGNDNRRAFCNNRIPNERKTYYDNHATLTARWPSVVRHRYRSNSIGSPGKVGSQSSGPCTRGGKLFGSAHRRHGRLVPVPNVWLRSHGDVEGDWYSSL